MKKLKGQVAVVTGGARGIGRECCRIFAREGAAIVFTYNKSKKEAAALKKELASLKAETFDVQTDVRDYDQCRQVLEKTLKKFKKLDILVNNAGIVKDRALVMMTLDDWKEVIDTNLGGTFNMTRACITTFLKQKKGCIINISSVSGLRGIPRQTNYSAAKAGIIGFSRSLAREVAPYNIRVNTVCPGFIETDMVGSLRDDIKKTILGSIPVKRFGTAEEVAELCLYLAADTAKYITGETLTIDGGLSV